jgi:hypothetical protein
VHESIGDFTDKQLPFLKDIGGIYETYAHSKNDKKKEAMEDPLFKGFVESLYDYMKDGKKVKSWMKEIGG